MAGAGWWLGEEVGQGSAHHSTHYTGATRIQAQESAKQEQLIGDSILQIEFTVTEAWGMPVVTLSHGGDATP